MISFGVRLQLLRKRNNLTQQDMAKICGVSAKAISRYENGTAEPDFEMLKKIARTFNTDVNTLIGYSHKCEVPDEFDLSVSKDEIDLILGYRKCNKSIQCAINILIKETDSHVTKYLNLNQDSMMIHEEE